MKGFNRLLFTVTLIVINAYSISKNFPCDIKGKIIPCADTPFYKGNAAVFDFNSGDACGVDAASGIKVRGIFFTNHWVMGMAGNQDMVVFCCPGVQAFFCFSFFGVVFCRTGRVWDAKAFKRLPYISNQKA